MNFFDHKDLGNHVDAIREGLAKGFEEECLIQRWPLAAEEVRTALAPVIEMNAQGLAVWHAKRGKA